MMQSLKIFLIFFILPVSFSVSSQNIDVNKKITVCEGYLSPQKALLFIEKNENIKFSYNPRNFNPEPEIYICKRNTELQNIVSFIMGQEVELVTENNYVIIKPKYGKDASLRSSTVIPSKIKTFRLNGIVVNSINNVPIDSVLVSINNTVTYTNEAGYFSLITDSDSSFLTLLAEKKLYFTEKLKVIESEKTLRIYLEPVEDINYNYMPLSVKGFNSIIENHKFVNTIVKKDQLDISKSQNILVNKNVQVSILPNVGTYWNKSGLYRFKRSYNIFAGYVGEVYGCELGLGINIVRYDVIGFQFAGLANIVGGEVNGVQMSLGGNVSIENFSGYQFSTIANTTWKNFKGLQFSAFLNHNKGKFRGLQLGTLNIVNDTLLGWQAGILNFTGISHGPQLTAFMNYNLINNKLQLSAFFNINKKNNAPQIGIFNISDKQDNLQLGLINVADSVSGISIGFLSFVKKGYTHFDYSFSNNLTGELHFKTGTYKFYNIISTGTKVNEEFNLLIGYGFGSYFKIWRMLGIDTDIIVSNVFNHYTFENAYNISPQFDLNINYTFLPRFTVFCGVKIKALFTNQQKEESQVYYNPIVGNYRFYEKQYSGHATYIWPEFCIGIKI
ncbi:MAG: hypothetical protein LBQ22_03705 [Bacteroidales bacterium]|jgi:hypothetical protein|nr:hypothetical protein [Bacteroidales bacterium]